MPLVSVIMPVHNTAEYLAEAVESILGQTLKDLELIIIDDGSTDGSAEILDSYEDKRMRIVHQKNAGIASALNKGLELAQGKYIARMDSDDISLPDRLEKQVAFMEGHPTVGVLGTACRLFGSSAGVTKPRTESEEIKSWLLFGPCMAHPTVMMRRELIVKHDLRYDSEFEKAEDYELWIRFSRHCDMANIAEPLLLYRVHADQVTIKLKTLNSRISGLIHKLAINSLGIEPSSEEMQLHSSLHSSGYETSREYVERAEAWLLKLLEANQISHTCERRAFAAVMFEFWRSLFIHEMQLGPWMFRKFIGSKVARGQSTMSSISFLLRAVVSRMLNQTSAGRSFKQLARGGVASLRGIRN